MNQSQGEQQQPKDIHDLPLQNRKMTIVEWRQYTDIVHQEVRPVRPGDSIKLDNGTILMAVRVEGQSVECIAAEENALSEREARLMKWALQQSRQGKGQFYQSLPETERYARELGEWIQEQMDAGISQTDIPDSLNAGGRLFSDMIPFLIVSEHDAPETAYGDLDKLLKSFFAEEAILIPLKEQEWLILGPVSLLKEAESDDRTEDNEESAEEMLASICSGLHGMLVSEWIGECHLSVAHAITPAKSVVQTTMLLHETIYLGRKFHFGVNIHLPWLLYLERLLNSIPEPQRLHYMEQVMNRSDVLLEPEIMMTLETFFGLDCNVSETAKKLYIHRNTLLYRLDKLKQETGLDVRVFSDAVLVKIILLLYKVTKRK
jgi:carbohydrate diacid regulator